MATDEQQPLQTSAPRVPASTDVAPATLSSSASLEELLADVAKGYTATATILRRLAAVEAQCEALEPLHVELGRVLARVDALDELRERVAEIDVRLAAVEGAVGGRPARDGIA